MLHDAIRTCPVLDLGQGERVRSRDASVGNGGLIVRVDVVRAVPARAVARRVAGSRSTFSQDWSVRCRKFLKKISPDGRGRGRGHDDARGEEAGHEGNGTGEELHVERWKLPQST